MYAPEVDELLRALGGPDAVATITAFCGRGPDVIAELFAALRTPFTGAPDRNGRAVFEDEGLCMHRPVSARSASAPRNGLPEAPQRRPGGR